MFAVRKATDQDKPILKQMIALLDLDYQRQSLNHFWLAEENKKKIVGLVQLEPYKDFAYLGSLGVLEEYRQQGIARQLLQNILGQSSTDTYLYTIIPQFFANFGFKIVPPPGFIPTKEHYKCNECDDPQKCVCMIWKKA